MSFPRLQQVWQFRIFSASVAISFLVSDEFAGRWFDTSLLLPRKSMAPAVNLIASVSDPDWDSKVCALPGAGAFHSAAWARVLYDTYKYVPHYLTYGDDSQILGAMPIMGITSWLTGRRGVSLPFTDECAPLCRDQASFVALYDAAQARGRSLGWKYLELRGGLEWLGPAGQCQPSTSFWGHRLALSADEAALFAGIESSGRRAVRKAEQSNLQIEVSSSVPVMEEFYRLMCQTRKRHGVPPQSWSFFANIQRHLLEPGRGCIVLARLGKVAVAGAVYIHSEKTTLYKFGASDETRQQLRANNLVMWHGIKWHAQRGFTCLDFGRTSLHNEGLRRFKLSWGTSEYRIDYAKLDLRTGRFVTAEDRASGWHNRIFQRLPIRVSQLIGRVLYPHVA
jgi:hypothetical protein